MLRLFIVFLLSLPGFTIAQPPQAATPDSLYGQLFVDVQLKRIFPDSKTFVDAVPLHPVPEILALYDSLKTQAGFDLRRFVLQHFELPKEPPAYSSTSADIRQHISALWKVLKRSADTVQQGSSLLPLPHPYIVPGGRFREVYYWDSYFTMLGLKESGEFELMENIVKNFAYLAKTYGHIPNGNRSYYLSRSQPPFFSLMLDLLAEVKGNSVYGKYLYAIDKETGHWNNAPMYGEPLSNRNTAFVVKHRDGAYYLIHRYNDRLSIPRQESYFEDVEVAENAALEYRKMVRFADSNKLKKDIDSIKARVWHNLRSAAASGWDFSSRWFIGGDELYNTETARVFPVDLSCLAYHLQVTYYRALPGKTSTPRNDLPKTKKDLRTLFFNEQLGWYCDYDAETKQVMNNPTLAGMFPLFFKLADEKDVPRIVAYLKKNFLKDGGVVTTLNNTGQQWDAPNGWAPLQWITIIGLENYGYHDLAKEIATRWVTLNKKVFKETGKLMEKYDVVDINRPAGGGEYPSQDGFGWTNGVLLALMNKYNL